MKRKPKPKKFVFGYGMHHNDLAGRPEFIMSICYNDGQMINKVYCTLHFVFRSFDDGMIEATKILNLLNNDRTKLENARVPS